MHVGNVAFFWEPSKKKPQSQFLNVETLRRAAPHFVIEDGTAEKGASVALDIVPGRCGRGFRGSA